MLVLLNRRPNEPVIVHSDKGGQFTSKEFSNFCELNSLHYKRSVTSGSRGNLVIESLNSVTKRHMRERIDPKGVNAKPGSFADPLRKLSKYSSEQVSNIIKYAIESHNNGERGEQLQSKTFPE